MDGTVWFPRDYRIERPRTTRFRAKTTFIILGSLAIIGIAVAAMGRHDAQVADALARWVVAIAQNEM